MIWHIYTLNNQSTKVEGDSDSDEVVLNLDSTDNTKLYTMSISKIKEAISDYCKKDAEWGKPLYKPISILEAN